MPKQPKQRRSTDENEVAFRLVEMSTQEPPANPIPVTPSDISRVMAELGRRGGQIGGKRRLQTMTKTERRKIAKKAAMARWKKTGH